MNKSTLDKLNKVANIKKPDPDAFITSEWAEATGISLSTAKDKLNILLKQGIVERAYAKREASTYPGWKLVKSDNASRHSE